MPSQRCNTGIVGIHVSAETPFDRTLLIQYHTRIGLTGALDTNFLHKQILRCGQFAKLCQRANIHYVREYSHYIYHLSNRVAQSKI